MILPIDVTILGYPGPAENVKKACFCSGAARDDSGLVAGRSRPTSAGKERWCAKKATFRGYKTHFAAPFRLHLDVKCASSIAGLTGSAGSNEEIPRWRSPRAAVKRV